MAGEEFTVALKDDGRSITFPAVEYKCACETCGREIVVIAAINGSNHNIGVWARCANCNANALATAREEAERYRAALEKAHDRMDDHNANERKTTARCSWCGGYGHGDYDANGLLHDDDCILVEIRQLLNPIPSSDAEGVKGDV